MKNIYLALMLGIFLVRTLSALTIGNIIYDGKERTKVNSTSILSEFEEIKIERYIVNDSTGYIMKINISSKNYTSIAHYQIKNEPNFWEVTMALQELHQENQELKIALCILDKTNSTGIC